MMKHNIKTITLQCSLCSSFFERPEKQYKHELKRDPNRKKIICSTINCPELSKNKIRKFNCLFCGVENSTAFKNKEKIFCNRNCSASYNNNIRKEQNYSTKDKTKIHKCIECSMEFEGTIHLNKNIKYCLDCSKTKFNGWKCLNSKCNTIFDIYPKSGLKLCDSCVDSFSNNLNCNFDSCSKQISKYLCRDCSCFIKNGTGVSKYCSVCLLKRQKNCGLKSANSQQRRSKNEIYMYELCAKVFDNVLNNDAIFIDKNNHNWDADIILTNEKVAILWNGVYHYKEVSKKQSLLQVQTRDKIKAKVIADNGYELYIIKDMR